MSYTADIEDRRAKECYVIDTETGPLSNVHHSIITISKLPMKKKRRTLTRFQLSWLWYIIGLLVGMTVALVIACIAINDYYAMNWEQRQRVEYNSNHPAKFR